MGQEIVTYSQVLTHPFRVTFVCEHCGESNTFDHEIVGAGKKSIYRGQTFSKAPGVLSPKDQGIVLQKAQKDLDRGVRNAKAKLAKGKYSWIHANKCSKCKRYQSWHIRQIWKNFFANFFGGPLMLMILVFFPLSIVLGRDTSRYPGWIAVVLSILMVAIMIAAVVNLLRSLISRRGKHHNLPTVTL